MKDNYLEELISRASDKAGSDYALAKMLDTTRQTVSDWRHNRKPCPIGDVALMAEVAGLKPEEWLARAVVAKYEGTAKGDKLYRALGKALGATGAALVSFGASTHPIFSLDENNNIVSYLIRCIEVLTRRRQLVMC